MQRPMMVVGERIYTKLLDLIWRMDHGEGYRTPEEIEAWNTGSRAHE